MTKSALLEDRGVLGISGEEAKPFLQGLITNNIEKLTPGNMLFSALLSPQGKFLYDFFLIEQQGKILLETNKERLPELLKRLAMYKLRAKVEFTLMPHLQVMAVWDASAAEYADPRLAELGARIVGQNISAKNNFAEYEHHRISLGVPEGSKDLAVDRSLILEYGYDELGAVDFTKGCYVGQEVTARSKHRATLRKFIHQVSAEKSLPPAGSKIMAGDHEVGIMHSSVGNIGLALLQVAQAQKAAQLLSEGIRINARLPLWCKTTFEREAK